MSLIKFLTFELLHILRLSSDIDLITSVSGDQPLGGTQISPEWWLWSTKDSSVISVVGGGDVSVSFSGGGAGGCCFSICQVVGSG